MRVVARLLRRVFLAPRHLRAAPGPVGHGRVATRCGTYAWPARTCAPYGPVAVVLTSSRPREWSHLRPEHWVTCRACRDSEGWTT